MARFSRRRTRRRTTRRKSRRAPRRRVAKRYGGKRRGGLTQSTKYVIQRSREDIVYNLDPADGAPQIAFNPEANGYISIIENDPTRGPELAGCKNWGLAFSDRLDRLPNTTDFQQLFGFYKILRITRSFTPVYGPGATATFGYVVPGATFDATASSGWPTPSLLYLPDRDSANPIYLDPSRETQGVRRRKMGSSFTHSFRPTPIDPIGQANIGPSMFAGIPGKAPWISSINTTIQHYGMRYSVIDWPGPNNNVGVVEGDAVPCAWRIRTTYTIMLKGVQ